jgi:hypothetical protein
MLALALAAVLATLSAAAAFGQPQEQGTVSTTEPEDFRVLVETARARGMSEDAYSTLKMIAGMRAKSTLLSFVKNHGRGGYRTWYTAALGSNSGADPEEVRKLRAQQREKEEAVMPSLKKWADLDGSGFVSSKEADRLRRLYEFGPMVHFVAAEEKTRDAKAVAEALQMPLAELLDNLREYKELRQRHGEEFGPVLTLDLPADASSKEPTPRAPARG